MKETKRYYHAVITKPERCDGCMKCLKPCPTEALRVWDDTPVILEDLCIDCGACISACPRKAILPDVDLFKKTSTFEYKVAIPSLVLYSQFGLETSPREIHLALNKLGFQFICDVSAACEMEALAVQMHLDRAGAARAGADRASADRAGVGKKPLISQTCPAVVRLIQVKYPTLVDRVIPFEPPRELSARETKIKVAKEHGIDIRNVEAFYISPCPAKSISVLQPAEKKRSFLDGVISISDLFVPLRKAIKELTQDEIDSFPEEKCVFGKGWERTGLMSRSLNIKSWIAVSDLNHVIRILDDIEEGKLDSVDFVEANACFEGCLGGCLNVENIYVARSKALTFEEEHTGDNRLDRDWVRQLYDSGYFHIEEDLEPRTKQGESSSLKDGIRMEKKKDELKKELPGLDCSVCGAPSCETFANDVILGLVDLESCPYRDS